MRSSLAKGTTSNHVLVAGPSKGPLDFLDSIEKLLEQVKYNLTLGSVDAQLLLRELYDGDMMLTSPLPKVEDAFMQVMYREQEDTTYFNSLAMIIQEFMALDMSKHLGLSIKDYLDATPREAALYVKYCEERVKLIADQMQELQNETRRSQQRVKDQSRNLDAYNAANLELGDIGI